MLIFLIIRAGGGQSENAHCTDEETEAQILVPHLLIEQMGKMKSKGGKVFVPVHVAS
jgi:hypothetical protein